MTRRFRAREVALQLLFQRDANPDVSRRVIESFARERLREDSLVVFSLSLLDGAAAHSTEIDALLTSTATNWRLVRMNAVDRNVLRLGVLELLWSPDETPPAVALNESIELARRYGSADSAAFVNGILDKIHQSRTATPAAETTTEADPIP